MRTLSTSRTMITLAGTVVVLTLVAGIASWRSASANHVNFPAEITISSADAGTSVPVGSEFEVTLAVTNPAIVQYHGVRWELAYSPNIRYVSTTYSCSSLGLLSPVETAPAEVDAVDVGLTDFAGFTILGRGSQCLDSFTSTAAIGTAVTVTLRCESGGESLVMGIDSGADDPVFGTTLLDDTGNDISTFLEEAIPGTTPLRVGFSIGCGEPSTPTPTATVDPSTTTPTSTDTPEPEASTPTPSETSEPPANTSTATATFTATSTAPPTPCPDLNGDGALSPDDVRLVIRAVRTQDPAGDVNDDGLVNFDDVALVVAALSSRSCL